LSILKPRNFIGLLPLLLFLCLDREFETNYLGNANNKVLLNLAYILRDNPLTANSLFVCFPMDANLICKLFMLLALISTFVSSGNNTELIFMSPQSKNSTDD
jgi:hypothetical protein